MSILYHRKEEFELEEKLEDEFEFELEEEL
jgi:hypothetical protein